ncbi:hypothetical protein ACFC58_43060 [Kitasatospora purpeofusca]|uniref:hypothetical protein n=1 Tax=Kitasatospora purpeofusca TaxID=67352 RepID=UPI0035D9D109
MTRYRLLLQQIRTAGRYPGDTDAERVLDAVLSALTTHTDDHLTDRLLAHLPRGYALLFGRADLAAAA